MNQNRFSQIDWMFLNGLAVYVAINLALSGFFYFATEPIFPLPVLQFAAAFLAMSIAFGPPIALGIILSAHGICKLRGISGPGGFVSLIVIIASILTSCIDLIATARIFAGC